MRAQLDRMVAWVNAGGGTSGVGARFLALAFGVYTAWCAAWMTLRWVVTTVWALLLWLAGPGTPVLLYGVLLWLCWLVRAGARRGLLRPIVIRRRDPS